MPKSSLKNLSFYDYFLMFGVLYTMIGSDLMLNWGAGLITGKRLSPESNNPLEKLYYNIHAINDPNMRSTPPTSLPRDKIPPWNHALAVSNGTLVLALEIMLLMGFYNIYKGESGEIPKYLQFASSAWIMRSVWGDISYWHELAKNPIERLKGKGLWWYYLLALPQIMFPWLIAERFYAGTYDYKFNPARFAIFVSIPIIMMIAMALLYR